MIGWLKRLGVLACLISAHPFIFAAEIEQINKLIEQGRFDQAATLALDSPQHYLHTLLHQSRDRHLHADPVWQVLMFYKTDDWGEVYSQVDDPRFFMSKQGHRDPWKELAATLASFYSQKPVEPTIYSPQCRFPARFFWLKRQLQFDTDKLPVEHCKDFDLFLDFVKPASVTVIFPSTHPNSPSSMFGHTLLRFNKANRPEEARMLDYSVSYAADIDTSSNGFDYAIRGMSGGFPGKFNFMPYYSKLREYAEMENRDLWEFKLNLSQEQVNFIYRHAYEIGSSFFQYYFFTENCSYHLLSLLDAAYPENRLTDELRPWTIPIDTVKIMDERGLVDEVNFFPSLAREIKFNMNRLNPKEAALAYNAYENGLATELPAVKALPPANRARVLDTLGLLFQYRRFKESNKLSPKLSADEKRILSLRSKIKHKSDLESVPAPSIRPDRGHDTARISVGVESVLDETYKDLEWRSAYHDLLDPSAGFVSNSGLEFATLRLRFESDSNKLRIQELGVFDIFSAEPRDRIFKSISWHLHLNHQRKIDEQDHWAGMNNFDGGAGLTYALGGRPQNIVYMYADLAVRQGRLLEQDASFMAGINLGMVLEPVSGWRIITDGRHLDGVWGDKREHYFARLSQSIALDKNASFRFYGKREKFLGQIRNSYGLSVHYYY